MAGSSTLASCHFAPSCLSSAAWLLMICCPASLWPKTEFGSWWSDGVVSDGATGPVPGESHRLFGLVSAELESCFSETHWPINS